MDYVWYHVWIISELPGISLFYLSLNLSNISACKWPFLLVNPIFFADHNGCVIITEWMQNGIPQDPIKMVTVTFTLHENHARMANGISGIPYWKGIYIYIYLPDHFIKKIIWFPNGIPKFADQKLSLSSCKLRPFLAASMPATSSKMPQEMSESGVES